jgi:cellulose synthase operon protein C
MTALSKEALGAGIDKYVKKDYKGALLEFKRAIGLDPHSEFSADATKYLAMSHQRLGQTDKAIDTYKQALKTNPDRDEFHLALGNIYFGEERVSEAIKSYEAAVRYYDSTDNRFALGQGYLKAGRNEDAATQFQKVIKMDPRSPNGFYGLGQAYGAQKRYGEAINQLERAIQRNKKFYAAYAEIGYLQAGRRQYARSQRDAKFSREKG